MTLRSWAASAMADASPTPRQKSPRAVARRCVEFRREVLPGPRGGVDGALDVLVVVERRQPGAAGEFAGRERRVDAGVGIGPVLGNDRVAESNPCESERLRERSQERNVVAVGK